MYYIAYGSNMNLAQMARRCPGARVVGMGLLRGWKLTFNVHADNVPGGAEDATPAAALPCGAGDGIMGAMTARMRRAREVSAVVYAMADIHGMYDKYRAMLEQIGFCGDDELYVLGDVVDRGPQPVEVLRDMAARDNVFPILGNHDLTAADLLDYMRDFSLYEAVDVGERSFILVHAGLQNFDERRRLRDYGAEELILGRHDCGRRYFSDPSIFIVTGHTPTLTRTGRAEIYRENNNICIDCGAYLPEGRLACLRLDDLREFYV